MTACPTKTPLARCQRGPARGGWRVTGALRARFSSHLLRPKAAPGAGSAVGGWRVTPPPPPRQSRPTRRASRPPPARLCRRRVARDRRRPLGSRGTRAASPARPLGSLAALYRGGASPTSGLAGDDTLLHTLAGSPAPTALLRTKTGTPCSASAHTASSASPEPRGSGPGLNFPETRCPAAQARGGSFLASRGGSFLAGAEGLPSVWCCCR